VRAAPLTGDALARACADAMLERDRHSRGLGMRIDEAREGYCRVSLTVTDAMLNGHDIVHGGVTFSLADSAFAFACNSRNEPNVALQTTLSFTTAGRLGDVLTAEAVERSGKSRISVYDVTVTRNGEVMALFRGTSYRIRGTVLRENGD